MLRQLKNNRGESLAEVLIAVLIIAAGLLALAGMVRVATKTVTNSKTTVGHFYNAENTIESEKAGSSSGNSNGTASIGTSNNIPVNIFSGDYKTAAGTDKKVYRYEVQTK